MEIDLTEMKDILLTFGRQLAWKLTDEEIEASVEEYMEANEDRFLNYETFRTEDD